MTTDTTNYLTPDQLADAIDAEVEALWKMDQILKETYDTFRALSLSVRNLSVRMTAVETSGA